MTTPENFYDEVGGEETFSLIVHRFYEQVPQDDILGPMYPPDDFEGAEQRLKMFLSQYWGGPKDYQEQRGHPRLRMRHAHYPIGVTAAERWLELMSNALDGVELTPTQREAIWEHMLRAADMLINANPDPHQQA
ncbi:globin [Corynebacterium crudilactis]|uniref:Hemin receptor n=1 Tax=Corynebacterium crudilactis TaxID=1652495 RepID=A0A172QVE3_9CORY|nr:globin [Corynebacterium crudilactis]ANE04677.1 hemin receptor [Corynebacterium crudilactis]